MNYVKKLNLHWFCTQNHILEPFSVRRACTKSYVTSEPYPRASQIWCQNVRETWKKKVIKCRGESFARCRVIARNVEGGGGLLGPPPPVFLGLKSIIPTLWGWTVHFLDGCSPCFPVSWVNVGNIKMLFCLQWLFLPMFCGVSHVVSSQQLGN